MCCCDQVFSSPFQIFQDPESDTVNLPWTLEAGRSRESQFSFTADDDTIPHKLRGSLSYTQVGIVSLQYKELMFIILY